MRLYHGWFSGLKPTENRRAIEKISNESLLPNVIGKVHFNWNRIFGDTLISASDVRLHPRLKIHLPNTLRKNLNSTQELREKMVDSALICDLLSSARSWPKSWRIVMGEDDDLIPGVFVSEFWGHRDGKTFLLRTRNSSEHLNLSGLLYKIGI